MIPVALRTLFRAHWIECIIIPPFLIAACYWLYGAAFWASWSNFGRMLLPWCLMAPLSAVCCNAWRLLNIRRFPRLADWPKMALWNLGGYLLCTVGFTKTTYMLLSLLPYPELTPAAPKYYGLLMLITMCVLIISTMYEGFTYFGKWRDALIETEQLEQLTLETQFQSLQSQLNPHFLFNSLNVLSSLIREQPRRAEAFVDELSNVYRYLLRTNERELTSVEEELRFIRSYFHLLATRHDDGISLDIRISAALYTYQIPALALQILVENAVKHNEISPEKPLHIHGQNVVV